MPDDRQEVRPTGAWTPIAVGEPAASPILVRWLGLLARTAAARAAPTRPRGHARGGARRPWMENPIGGPLPMKPNTALMVVGSALSLWLLADPAGQAPRAIRSRWALLRRRWVARALALASGAIAVATWMQDVLGRDLGIDTLLVRADPARPALPTVVALTLLNAALLVLDVRRRRGPKLAEVLALAAAVIASLTLGGFLFGATQFYVSTRSPHGTGMALHTSVTLLVLALGILAARPTTGAMSVVTSPLVGGQVVRKMLPLVLCIFVLGYLAVRAQRAGLYAPPGAAVVTSVASMLVAGLIALAVGHSLNRADALRRRTEAEIREWKRFFDRATFGAVFGTIDGRLGRINEAFARMHGSTIAELEGAPIVDVFPPDRRAELAEKTRVTHELGHCRWESEHLRKDGSTFPVVIDMTAVRDGRGELLYRAAYIQDITEEKKAETVRARLASLVQSADDAIFVQALDGTVLDWNRGAERVYGFAADEIVGRSISPTVPEDRRAEQDALGAKVLGGEIVVGFETVRLRKDGTPVPISLTLSPIYDPVERVVGISSIARDISLEKQIEAELRSTREREMAQRTWLEAVIEHTPEGIVILDEHGRVVLQNAAAASLASGAGPLDPSGEPWPYDVRSPSGERLAIEEIPGFGAFLRGETIGARELAVAAPSGELVPVLVSAAPVDVDGVRRGAVAIFRDIRAIKQLEREREEWSSVVAHDLRQPASTIRLAAEVIARVEGPAKLKAVEHVRRASARLERMIEDLLDVSCIEARRLEVRSEEVNLPALFAEVLDLAPEIASRCRTEIDPGAGRVRAAAPRVVQVLSNLLSNADKYSDPGTPIDVRVEASGEMVTISVTNEGPGIAPDETAMLFSRFARTRSARAGTAPGLGLGLYICRGIVEALGGKLWVESVPGEKTHFRFTLPLAPAPEAKLSA